ncbi:MAG: thioredoxin [Archangium sp.]
MSKDTVTVLDATFKNEVLDSTTPVLVDFWATWCAPCRAIAPSLEELATQYKGQVKIAKVDVDENQAIARQFGIRSIPTLILFKGGKAVETLVGALPKAKLEDSIKKAL